MNQFFGFLALKAAQAVVKEVAKGLEPMLEQAKKKKEINREANRSIRTTSLEQTSLQARTALSAEISEYVRSRVADLRGVSNSYDDNNYDGLYIEDGKLEQLADCDDEYAMMFARNSQHARDAIDRYSAEKTANQEMLQRLQTRVASNPSPVIQAVLREAIAELSTTIERLNESISDSCSDYETWSNHDF